MRVAAAALAVGLAVGLTAVPNAAAAAVQPLPAAGAPGPAAGPAAATARPGSTARPDTVRPHLEPHPRWSLAARGGFSSPKGDLADLGDDGQFVGFAPGYRISPRVTLLLEGSLENLERAGRPRTLGGIRGPDIELWRLMAVGSLELTDPLRSRWEVSGQGGAGVTWVAVGAFADREAYVAPEPTVMLGVTTGYDLNRRFTVFVRADFYLWFDDTEAGDVNFFGKEDTLTHTLGLRVGL